MILISPNDVKYVTRRCDGVLLNVPYRINKRSLAFLELILTEYLDHVCFGLDLGLPLGYPDDRKITKRTKKSYISSIHNLCVRASALSLRQATHLRHGTCIISLVYGLRTRTGCKHDTIFISLKKFQHVE